MDSVEPIRARLEQYFTRREEVSMAFLFGSFARSQQTCESDIDVGIYFCPGTARLEWEEERTWAEESGIWTEVQEITQRETDLVVLNRAPATVSYAVLAHDVPIVVKDRALYWRFFLTVSSAAEDFREFTREYRDIKHRSASLSEVDRDRLLRIVDFLETELADFPSFTELTRKEYLSDSVKRRNAERWVENVVNASIDIAKILLASEQVRIPQTYREILRNLDVLESFETPLALQLAGFSRLRNILAHEYLDIRFGQIARFVRDAEPVYRALAGLAGRIVDNPDQE